ncbi:MAG: hypothetical protein DRJ60_06455 [Thermoprotei archaeon]|nr:MAG: hypothetical protein DRJ60_06455 [Thermoprotei archaeon]
MAGEDIRHRTERLLRRGRPEHLPLPPAPRAKEAPHPPRGAQAPRGGVDIMLVPGNGVPADLHACDSTADNPGLRPRGRPDILSVPGPAEGGGPLTRDELKWAVLLYGLWCFGVAMFFYTLSRMVIP